MELDNRKNTDYLDKKIDQIKLNGNKIVVFDFDELLVPIHLTRKVTKKISKPVDKSKMKGLNLCSFEGIVYLNGLMKGQNKEEYERLRDDISKKVKWSKGFDRLIKRLCKEFTVIIISAGLKDICFSKLKDIGFDERNIFGGKLLIPDNKIEGSELVISYIDKGYIVKKLKANGNFVISVGHGLGDKEMLINSDVSIAYKSDVPNMADYYLDNISDLESLLTRSLDKN